MRNETVPASTPSSVNVAERFELYISGLELANGYHELLDAAELRRRNGAANAERVAEGKPVLPEESRLLAAMETGLPACTGVALGFDRLVMVAVGAKTLADVLAFPIDRA
jgi:lysyl-tRNA synthetase class 2